MTKRALLFLIVLPGLSACTIIPPADPARSAASVPMPRPGERSAPVPAPAPKPSSAPAPVQTYTPTYQPEASQPPAQSGSEAPAIYAALGQPVYVDGPRVTVLNVLEDSRCPAGTHCVWPGQVRISVKVDLGSGSETYEIKQGHPVVVADGTLELVDVRPDRTGQDIAPSLYRFGFRFAGGY